MTRRNFFHFVAEEKKKKKKKKDDKKTKAFYDWATTGIPVMISRRHITHSSVVIKYCLQVLDVILFAGFRNIRGLRVS